MKSPRLFIPRKVYQQLMHWVNKSEFEVSWLGTLQYNPKECEFEVLKIFLLEQENERAETTIKAAAICDLEYDTRNEPGQLRWWGHSHVKMPCFWSGTDREAMDELSQNGWFLSTVFNQKKEMRTAFTQGGEMPIMLDDIETYIYDPITDEETAEWDAQYKKNVTNKTYTYTMGYGNGSGYDWKNYGGYNKTEMPQYSADEYKILNQAISHGLSEEQFYEQWKKTGKDLPKWVKHAPCVAKSLAEEEARKAEEAKNPPAAATKPKMSDDEYADFLERQSGSQSGTKRQDVGTQLIMQQIADKKSETNSDDGPSITISDDDEAYLDKLIQDKKAEKNLRRRMRPNG